jgi:hypothetical protein
MCAPGCYQACCPVLLLGVSRFESRSGMMFVVSWQIHVSVADTAVNMRSTFSVFAAQQQGCWQGMDVQVHSCMHGQTCSVFPLQEAGADVVL